VGKSLHVHGNSRLAGVGGHRHSLGVDSPPALQAEQVTKRYRAHRPPALASVDVSIKAGSIVALVGPNGAGKSTLIRLFLGFERPTSGRVLVTGIDPGKDRTAALAQIGYVGQAPGLYRDLTAGDHVALAAGLRSGFDVDGALQRLDDLGIERSIRAGELSGGQQAQLALGLALSTHAPVLLLDEPLASLDPLARRDFLGMVRGAAQAGATVLFASHIVGDLEAVCDRLLVLAPGRVMLDTSIDEARASYRVVPVDEAVGSDVIGAFDDHAGRARALVHSADPSSTVSLDDIVLGHLAGARGRAPKDGGAT
jgi:ABC-2 type transport system ATP-binding protein